MQASVKDYFKPTHFGAPRICTSARSAIENYSQNATALFLLNFLGPKNSIKTRGYLGCFLAKNSL